MISSPINFKSADDGTNWIINDQGSNAINLRLATSPFYYIAVTSADGVYSQDISYESHPIPHTNSEFSGDVYKLGQTITLTGTITGLNLAKLEEGAYWLRRMFSETAKRKLYFRPWNHRTADVFKICRVNQDLAIVETFEEGKYEWQWTVGLRSDDGKTYSSVGVEWDGS